MNKVILILIFVISSCTFFKMDCFDVGTKLDYLNIKYSDSAHIMDSDYNIQRCIGVEYNGIYYFIRTNYKNKINLIITFDDKFRTSENLSVGSKFSEFKNKSKLTSRYMDLYSYRLDSDWNAILRFHSNNDQNTPFDTTTILWFEKRTY